MGFDLDPYLRTYPGLLPSAYLGAVAVMAVGLAAGIALDIAAARRAARTGGKRPHFLLLPLLSVAAAMILFVAVNATTGWGRLYTYEAYGERNGVSVNAALARWSNATYGLHLSADEASLLKYREREGWLGIGRLQHPDARIDGRTVRLQSELRRGGVIIGTGTGSAFRELPRVAGGAANQAAARG